MSPKISLQTRYNEPKNRQYINLYNYYLNNSCTAMKHC